MNIIFLHIKITIFMIIRLQPTDTWENTGCMRASVILVSEMKSILVAFAPITGLVGSLRFFRTSPPRYFSTLLVPFARSLSWARFTNLRINFCHFPICESFPRHHLRISVELRSVTSWSETIRPGKRSWLIMFNSRQI